jgi:type IV secretory pathway VirB10-like protein
VLGGEGSIGDQAGGLLLPTLRGMGFPEVRCRKALRAGVVDVDAAVLWLCEHADDDGIDEEEEEQEPEPEPEEEEQEQEQQQQQQQQQEPEPEPEEEEQEQEQQQQQQEPEPEEEEQEQEQQEEAGGEGGSGEHDLGALSSITVEADDGAAVAERPFVFCEVFFGSDMARCGVRCVLLGFRFD